MSYYKYSPKSIITFTENDLNTSYETIFSLTGEGVVDLLQIEFSSINDVYIKVTVDDNTYYEFNLGDLDDHFDGNTKIDSFFFCEDKKLIDKYPAPMTFFDNYKVECKKTSGSRKIKAAMLRYRTLK